MSIILTIILGLIVGLLAKWVVPGKDPGGLIVTILIGIAGSFVGGFIGNFIGLGEMGDFSLGGIALSVVGAAVRLIGWRVVKNNMERTLLSSVKSHICLYTKYHVAFID